MPLPYETFYNSRRRMRDFVNAIPSTSLVSGLAIDSLGNVVRRGASSKNLRGPPRGRYGGAYRPGTTDVPQTRSQAIYHSKRLAPAGRLRAGRRSSIKFLPNATGAGIATDRIVKTKRLTAQQKKKTLKDKVLSIVAGDKESQSKMFMLRNSGLVSSVITHYGYVKNDLTSRYDIASLCYPTGLSDNSNTQANIEDEIENCGYTFFPFNKASKVAPTDDADDDIANVPTFQGQSFNPQYCVVDYGWKEGVNFATNSHYARTEVVFGVIGNAEALKDIMDHNSWSIETAMNIRLGTPGKLDYSIHGSDWPFRTIGDVSIANPANEEFYKQKQRLKGLIKILKRDINVHRPVTEISADGGDGVDVESSTELGRLFGSGSFVFPKEYLKKQELLESSLSSTGSRDSNVIHYQRNIPFVHIRGVCVPDSVTKNKPLNDTEANKSLALCLRYKIAITDDE